MPDNTPANVSHEALSTIGVTLSYSTTSSGTYTKLYSISRVPELEGAPEQIDVTPLSSGSRLYTPGVKDNQTVEFEGWTGKWGLTGGTLVDEYAALRALTSTNVHYFKIDYPDGSKQEFSGYPYARTAGSEVNGGQGYILAIILASAITFTAAS